LSKEYVVLYLYMYFIRKRKTWNFFCLHFLYVNWFFNTYTWFFFSISLYTLLFAFTLQNDLIYRSIDEKNSISSSPSSSVRSSSVNWRMSLMMKLISYRFFITLSISPSSSSLFVVNNNYIYICILRHEMILFYSQLLLLLMSWVCKYVLTTSFLFPHSSSLTENYLRANITRFTFFVIFISDWSHLHSSSSFFSPFIHFFVFRLSLVVCIMLTD